jgi:hypothetical protein
MNLIKLQSLYSNKQVPVLSKNEAMKLLLAKSTKDLGPIKSLKDLTLRTAQ